MCANIQYVQVQGNTNMKGCAQGRTDNSWGPWAIGDHGAPVSLPKLKKSL
ncbi:unnamed protein product [Staurois parvus]|uniref:Uncharacterized protein n=1 Tax=Staurois parvus TaxID=386267 RepID=A0ABN9AKH8_9NEOB|nr:unnamed protein product [Staurois parvus]